MLEFVFPILEGIISLLIFEKHCCKHHADFFLFYKVINNQDEINKEETRCICSHKNSCTAFWELE